VVLELLDDDVWLDCFVLEDEEAAVAVASVLLSLPLLPMAIPMTSPMIKATAAVPASAGQSHRGREPAAVSVGCVYGAAGGCCSGGYHFPSDACHQPGPPDVSLIAALLPTGASM